MLLVNRGQVCHINIDGDIAESAIAQRLKRYTRC